MIRDDGVEGITRDDSVGLNRLGSLGAAGNPSVSVILGGVIMDLEEKLKQLEAEKNNLFTMDSENRIVLLLAALRKCREQRRIELIERVVAENADGEFDVLEQTKEVDDSSADYDAELLSILNGGGE